MMVVAHPFEPFLPHLEGLLDEGLIDAVEIVNGGPVRLERHSGVLRWLADMQAKGRRVPVVGGMDIHIAEGSQRPDVCYDASFPPQADFPAIDRNRTAVLVDEPTPEAIVQAVRSGRSIVEVGGELLGDPQLVAQLQREGYWQARRAAQEQLDSITLAAADGPFLAAQDATLRPLAQVADAAVVRIFHGDAAAGDYPCRLGEKLSVSIPHAFDRNLFYLGASVEPAGRRAKAFALKVQSPLEIALLSEPQPGGRGRAALTVINRSGSVVAGSATLTPQRGDSVEPALGPLEPQAMQALHCDLPPMEDPSRPLEVRAAVQAAGLSRRTGRKLVFVGVPHIEEDCEDAWRDVPEIFIGRQDQLDPAWTHDWRGPADCSATVQWAWNSQALLLRAVVTDDVSGSLPPRPDAADVRRLAPDRDQSHQPRGCPGLWRLRLLPHAPSSKRFSPAGPQPSHRLRRHWASIRDVAHAAGDLQHPPAPARPGGARLHADAAYHPFSVAPARSDAAAGGLSIRPVSGPLGQRRSGLQGLTPVAALRRGRRSNRLVRRQQQLLGTDDPHALAISRLELILAVWMLFIVDLGQGLWHTTIVQTGP